tara:strand:- start:934 stop:1041 length:108 start_codon:yes stop_codon:yes gene_type:complete
MEVEKGELLEVDIRFLHGGYRPRDIKLEQTKEPII